MQSRPLRREPDSGSPPSRSAFDGVFERYVDPLWAGLAPHAPQPAVAEAVERIMTRLVLRWADGLPESELDALALELFRREEKAVARPARKSPGLRSAPP